MQEKFPPWPLSNLAWVHKGHICEVYSQSDLRVGGMPCNPPEMKGDKQPCGEVPGSSFSPNLVGQCHKTTSHPSLSFQLITGLSTSCLPPCRAQLLASVYTKLFGWKLEIAPLGQSDPLPVPPVFWPVQFSVIVYGELGRQGAEVMWIFLSLSK